MDCNIEGPDECLILIQLLRSSLQVLILAHCKVVSCSFFLPLCVYSFPPYMFSELMWICWIFFPHTPEFSGCPKPWSGPSFLSHYLLEDVKEGDSGEAYRKAMCIVHLLFFINLTVFCVQLFVLYLKST